MKAEVGYITAWRRGIFFSFIGAIILFGTANTLAGAYIKIVLVQNIIGVFALLAGIIMVTVVVGDPLKRYIGEGQLDILEDTIRYEDKKRHFTWEKNAIKNVDIQPIYIGQSGTTPLAYRIMIDTGKKKYYIESDRARGRQYNEVGLYKLYLCLQQNISGDRRKK
ncbi:MAG: hypothetical protein NC225_12010 [Clostridium sp.]|nr:hypothetical protein [Clostridium sp.]MCM1400192.1 hypothetical protein [Clostridium sp.]MCM1460939.1 hypothetical protein [Bacteroides sp.]